MKKLQWMLAAGVLCGATVFTACSDDSSSSKADPAEEQNQKTEKQTAFIENTRSNLKEVASNLNFASWNVANRITSEFNEYILTNSEFDKGISKAFSAKILETLGPVEKKSELAKQGYETYGVVDFSDFKYQFSVNKERTGFDVKKADNFTIIVPGRDVAKDKLVDDGTRLVLKTSGDNIKILAKKMSTEKMATVIKLPKEMSFTIDVKNSGKWQTIFSGEFTNEAITSGKSEYIDRMTTDFVVSGILRASIPEVDKDHPADSPELYFGVSQDPANHASAFDFMFVHNDKEIIDIGADMKNGNGKTDLSELTSSSNILDLFAAIIAGNSVENMEITLLEDMTFNIKVSDAEKLLKLHRETSNARRNYATEETIADYTKKMNKLMTMSLESKDTDQKIDVKLAAVKFGVDYWTMPAFKFSDADDYVSLLEILDQESMEYGLNILDHAVEPMAGSIVIVRQLLQYLRTLSGMFDEYQDEEYNFKAEK